MSYLLDRKSKRKKIGVAAVLLVFAAFLFYFKTPIFNSLSGVGHVVFKPFLILNNKTGSVFSGFVTGFRSKNSLQNENDALKLKSLTDADAMLNYNVLLAENAELKDILGRKGEHSNLLVSTILGKPNKSPYDTLVIDVGSDHGVAVGDMVFALGNIPIGRVAVVYANSSKVVLFSNSGEKTEVSVGGQNLFLEVVGRGGGNFELILPRDFILQKGDMATMPGIIPYVVAQVDTIVSDPRDSFTKALLSSPVNVQSLKFVQVKK